MRPHRGLLSPAVAARLNQRLLVTCRVTCTVLPSRGYFDRLISLQAIVARNHVRTWPNLCATRCYPIVQ
jgi:hypothetical protein